jgi:uncharacterized membrane protein YkvA (DUF1232 family)
MVIYRMIEAILNNLRIRAKRLKKELSAVYYAYKNPKISILPKILIAISIAYALSPIDLIPDFIPVFGYLDDLVIIPALLSLAIKLIPLDIMKESREKAETEPLTLRKNWIFAIIFILVWLIVIFEIVRSIFHIF